MERAIDMPTVHGDATAETAPGAVQGASAAGQAATAPASIRKASLREYLAIARLDHMTKHVFIIPGIILAYALREPPLNNAIFSIIIGFMSAVAIAAANYVINEWLDREFDVFHPVKSGRTAVHWQLSPKIIYLEYAVLVTVGILLAAQINLLFLQTSILFVISGIIYNVRPIRTKDLPYVDVISESLNNPIRLTLGWAMLDSGELPPVSLLVAYWAAGAFLMGAKRLSEYREISADAGVHLLGRYRRSFRYYNAESLTVSCFLYAMIAAFFIAIFLVKYRLEYIFALPFIAVLFASYLWLALLKGSIVQRPERMFRSKRLVAALCVAVFAMLLMSFWDMPFLNTLSAPDFTPVDKLK